MLAKIREEADEIEAELDAAESHSRQGRAKSKTAAEVGDLLFAVVNLARHLDADPESILRGTNAKFERRFGSIERALAAKGKTPKEATLAEMDKLWDVGQGCGNMTAVDRAINIEDLRRLALRRLPRFVGDYLEGGAGDGGGIRRNVDAFRKYQLVPRALADATPVDTTVELFGRQYASLFGISAVGLAGIYRRHADELLAEAARDANIPFILSGASTASIETVCRIAPDNTWYQLYGAHRPDVTERMMAQARDAGVKVLVYTVDYPVAPRSEVVGRTGVSMAKGPSPRTFPRLFLDAARHPSWTADYLRGGGLPKLESWAPYAPAGSNAKQVAAYYVQNWSNAQTWRDLDHIRAFWKGPLVVKGLVHSDDVVRAAQAGADAVTISNHGGNKLDCMEATLDALAQIRPAVGGDLRLFFDGGIRRGSDLIVAKAMGADFCFTGRATIYGVAAGGSRGAKRAIDILQSDLNYTMAMIGCRSVSAITRDYVTSGRHESRPVSQPAAAFPSTEKAGSGLPHFVRAARGRLGAFEPELRPYPRRLVGIGAHGDGQLAVVGHVLGQHFGVAIKPAQPRAVGRIERQVEGQLGLGETAFDRRR